jgi:hypothetical protein
MELLQTEEGIMEEVQTPAWVPQVKEEARGSDLNAFPTITDLVEKGYRGTIKERDTLKAEYEGYKAKAIPIPGESSKPEEIAAFRKALGVPDKPEGYTYKLPDGTPEDTLSADEMKKVLELVHKHNASPGLVQDLVNYEVQTIMDARKTVKEKNEADTKEAMEFVTKEFGADKVEAKLSEIFKVVDKFGGPELRKEFNETGMGNNPRLIVFLGKIAPFFSEKGTLPGGTGGAQEVQAGSEEHLKRVYKSSFAKGYMR